jgi:hypothetical protein
MTLGTPHDVTLQELRIETFFPADEESERCWIRHFGDPGPQAFSAPADPQAFNCA